MLLKKKWRMQGKKKQIQILFFVLFPNTKRLQINSLVLPSISVKSPFLGDKSDIFFDNGFGGDKKPLWSGYKRNKLPNPFSCMLQSFMKRPVKEGFYDTSRRSEIFCYTPQLSDKFEEANRNNTMPYIAFTEVNKETFGDAFYPPDLISLNLEKKAAARKAVIIVAKIMCKENKKRLANNLDNVIKFLPNDR